MSKPFFSGYHFDSAAQNILRVKKIESFHEHPMENLDKVFENKKLRRWSTLHDSFVISSILASFAGVEANINEFVEDTLLEGGEWIVGVSEPEPGAKKISRSRLQEEEFPNVPKGFDQWRKKLMKQKHDSVAIDDFPKNIKNLIVDEDRFFRKYGTLEKYQMILITKKNSNPFEKGKLPLQDMYYIKRLRNEFTHWKPERYEKTPEGEPPDSKIGRSLYTKNLEENPFSKQEDPFFPRKCLSYEYSKWVYNTCLNFIEKFYEKINTEEVEYFPKINIKRLRNEINKK